MAKQKIVMKMMSCCEKKKREALKKAAMFSGVESVGIEGPDKQHIVVTGEGIDSVELTRLLRKRVGHTEIVSVGLIKEEKKDKPATQTPETKVIRVPFEWWPQYPHYVQPVPLHVVHEDPWNSCSIL